MEVESRRVVREFRKRRKRQLVVTGPFVLFIIYIVFTSENDKLNIFNLSETISLIIVFSIIIAMLVFSFKNWRCPACDKYLGKGINFKFCPRCGIHLSDKS